MSKRKRTQWFGGGQVIEPETDASTSTAEVLQLIPSIQTGELAQEVSEFTIEAIYLHFSIRRILISAIDALGFLVYQGEVVEGGNNPAQALDALAQAPREYSNKRIMMMEALDALAQAPREYSNKRIMMMAPLPVPPILGTSDLLAFTTDSQVLVAHHEFQASRKHNRSNTILCMTVNCDISVATRIFCQWRVLVNF